VSEKECEQVIERVSEGGRKGVGEGVRDRVN